jgi:hypothetical protein
MAHYAFLDENNIVTEVIVGINETELIEGLDTETWYSNSRGQVCKRTSYNGNIRKNYAGIGYTYDPVNDWFYAPQPFASWTLDSDANWQAPVAYPTDGQDYNWNESTLSWDLDWKAPVDYPTDGQYYTWNESTLSWDLVE